MSFKEKILSKSNSYAYYKKENERLAKENQSLKNEIKSLKESKQKNLKNEFFEIYGDASSFCNWKYLDYFLKDDFEDILKNVTDNLDSEAKKKFKLILLRVLMVNMIRQTPYILTRSSKTRKGLLSLERITAETIRLANIILQETIIFTCLLIWDSAMRKWHLSRIRI